MQKNACILICDGNTDAFEKTLEAMEASIVESTDFYIVCNMNLTIKKLIEDSSIFFEEVFVSFTKTLEEMEEFCSTFEEFYFMVIIVEAGETFDKNHLMELINVPRESEN